MASTLPAGELFALDALVTPTAQGIASRVLARTAAGNITLFAFDAGEELSEHTAPFDALVITLSGALVLTIGGRDVTDDTAVSRADARERASCRSGHRGFAHAADHAARTSGARRIVLESQRDLFSGSGDRHHYFWIAVVQLRTTVSGAAALDSRDLTLTRNRCPSLVTAYA